jgi:hypothetical protein
MNSEIGFCISHDCSLSNKTFRKKNTNILQHRIFLPKKKEEYVSQE